MRDACARGIEVDTVFCCKHADFCILSKIVGRDILDVVVNRKHRLIRIEDARGTNRLELRNHRARVVVRHDVLGADHHELALTHDGALR